jgi:hypothetical protein
LSLWRGHVLKAPCRDEGERETLTQVEIRHVAFEQPNTLCRLGPLAKFGGRDGKHGGGEVQTHNVVSGLGERDQDAASAHTEFKDRATVALRAIQVELDVARKRPATNEEIVHRDAEPTGIVGVRIGHQGAS